MFSANCVYRRGGRLITTRRAALALALLLSVSANSQELPSEGDELAALRQIVIEQSRLIREQSGQLQELASRVAELEVGSGGDSLAETAITSNDLEKIVAEQLAEADVGERDQPTDIEELVLTDNRDQRTGIEAVIVDDPVVLSDSLDIYGSFRNFLEVANDQTEMKEGSSRLGFRLNREVSTGQTYFGRIEWRTNLVDDRSEFAVGTNTDDGIIIRPGDSTDVISLRLGYLGVRLDRIGDVSVGKQWSAYYDVARWTDSFNIYGGSALGVFPGRTDGGGTGSGRANNAIVWRNSIGQFRYSLQTQLQNTDDDEDYYNLGGSLIYAPNPHWQFGVAFNASKIEGGFEELTGDDESNVATIGVRYSRSPLTLALNVANWNLHESIFIDDDLVFYDSIGSELYAGYDVNERITLYAGYNYTDPDTDDDLRIDSDFGVERWLFGASWSTSTQSFAFLEALLNESTDAQGRNPDSVLAVGYRLDF